MIQKNKKSQVTIFLILGLVLIIIFTSVIMITRRINEERTDNEVTHPSQTTFDIQPIKHYIEECLSSVSKDGLVKLGRQGGYLFKSQGGTVVDYSDPSYVGSIFYPYGEHRVFYNILQPRFRFGDYFPPGAAYVKDGAQRYPWDYFPHYPNLGSAPTSIGEYAFGTNMMPDLVRSKHSIQKQLETYVDNNIDACLDFSVFEEQGFKITEKDGSREITFNINENDIVFTMNYPLIVESSVSGEKTEIKDFLVRHDFNLKQLHAFINGLIEEDVSNVEFPIETGSSGSFVVTKEEDVNDDNDDLIIITAQNSLIDGIPYQYYFMRKNRHPALEYAILPEHPGGENGCIYNPVTRRVDCDFEWHLEADDNGYCVEVITPLSYTIKDSYFLNTNDENKHDPDEDEDILLFGYEVLSSTPHALEDGTFTEIKDESTDDKLFVHLPGGCGGGGTIKIKQIVHDTKLEDWQIVIFDVHWWHGNDEDCICID